MQNSERKIAITKYQIFGWVYFILVFIAIISLVHYFQVSAIYDTQPDEIKHVVKSPISSGEVSNFDECTMNPDSKIKLGNPSVCVTANNQEFIKK
jgi:hypothetical protein